MSPSRPQPLDHQGLLANAMAPDGAPAPGAAPPPTIAAMTALFPDHEVLELIGRGGMGAVYKAVQKNLQRPVAIKILPRDLAADPEFGERFLREARTLATLNHPGILTVHDFGERDGQFFLITEFVDGVNLRQLMALGELSPAEALRIAPLICTALQYAHERGVVHRDIKPENILIDVEGRVKIADFGLAKSDRPGDQVGLTRQTAVFGTPHYMAPEQWRGTANVDHRADIYSLGVVLYEMLTGQLPLGNFDPPSQRRGVPPGLDEVVRRALAQQPANRYQRVSEVQSDVEREVQQFGAAPAPAPSSTDPTGGRHVKAPILALGVLLLAIAGVGWLVFELQTQGNAQARFRGQLAMYDAVTERAVDAIRAAHAVGDLPHLPSPPPPTVLSLDAIRGLCLGIGAGALLLVLASGAGALRAIRNSRQPVRGLGFAVVIAWLLPIGVVAGLPVAAMTVIADPDLKRTVAGFLGLVIPFASIWFLVRRLERERRLLREGRPMAGSGAWIVATWVSAALAFGAAAAMPFLFPAPTSVAAVTKAPTRPVDLLGATRDFVLARLGPPLGITVSAGNESWDYADPADTVYWALVFTGDEVVAYDRETVVLLPNDCPTASPTSASGSRNTCAPWGPR
ncbi:MAG: serine/threonine protein kinase [Planctomycetes bacterium]|nr:serine/threonine protein kinase [Planctomycetota bacterium]